jgi:superfamily II DNA or RNA helicase
VEASISPALAISIDLIGNDLVLSAPGWSGAELARRLDLSLVADRRPGVYRVVAGVYGPLRAALEAAGLPFELRFDPIPQLEAPPQPNVEARPYQVEALAAWRQADGRGVIELPTGAGKTVVALLAIADLGCRALVIVPTIDLLGQWARAFRQHLGLPRQSIALLGGDEREVGEITIATYQSALIQVRRLAGFPFLICDEVHHLPAPSFRRLAEGIIAPYRLGLSATTERSDGRHVDLDHLLGPLVYRRAPAELRAQRHLAQYREERVEVELSTSEARTYRKVHEQLARYQVSIGVPPQAPFPFEQAILRSSRDPEAREALSAWRAQRKLAWNAEAKLAEIERLLEKHAGDVMLLFSESNEMVERIAEAFCIPFITHTTPAEERRILLERFRAGSITKLVAGQVLNEGVDLPEARVAIVVSGSGTRREHVQRLGRILRPKAGEAVLYELVTRGTGEVAQAKRRRRAPYGA